MNEKKLAERLSNGDTEAFGKIMSRYGGYAYTVAYNFSQGALTNEDIDDVVTEVFARLWEHRKNIKADIGLRSYLSASVRNTVRNLLKQKRPLMEDIDELELPSDYLVENAAELNELMTCLYDGLEKLEKLDREVFLRFYFYGETAPQIASAKGTTKGAVDKRLSRIRKKLKEHLNERGFFYV